MNPIDIASHAPASNTAGKGTSAGTRVVVVRSVIKPRAEFAMNRIHAMTVPASASKTTTLKITSAGRGRGVSSMELNQLSVADGWLLNFAHHAKKCNE